LETAIIKVAGEFGLHVDEVREILKEV
jgi:hypothetical protein